MVDPFSRIVWPSLVIISLIVTTISSSQSQPKQRSTPPAVLFNPEYGTHKYATVNGIRLHYVEAGDRRKPLMVFLHGFPEFWYSWRYQIPEFSKDYWTVAVDMRGYGWSEKPIGETNYVLPILVEDLKAFVMYLSALTAALSYYRANEYAKNGKLVLSKVDVDIPLGGSNGMFILGGKDEYISQLSLYATAKQYPNMRVEVIPNATHFSQLNEPEITNKLIRDFLGPAVD